MLLKAQIDLKALFTQVDEVVDCIKIMLEEVQERTEVDGVSDCDEVIPQVKERRNIPFERQLAVNEEVVSNLESFNKELVSSRT